MEEIASREDLCRSVSSAVAHARVYDIHTHLYSEPFGALLLSGLDELLTYHYLVAEFFRYSSMPYDAFWALAKADQARLVWQSLFVERTPISEACRGALTVLKVLGADVRSRDLDTVRASFEPTDIGQYVDLVWEKARIEKVIMTNDPFDDQERRAWEQGGNTDPRFEAALRLDALLCDWINSHGALRSLGYNVHRDLSVASVSEVQRFLTEWALKTGAVYMAVSLPPGFNLKPSLPRTKLIEECVLPTCLKLGVPFAMMIGAKRSVNPGLREAGDAVGKADVGVLQSLLAKYPRNKFMATMLSKENQHELCVTARKFRNLMVFGCWWFLNNPSIVEEITRLRMETLGLSFVPQHSDARCLDQLIYKWKHAREVVTSVLVDKYNDVMESGWLVTSDDIQRDVDTLFSQGFKDFLEIRL